MIELGYGTAPARSKAPKDYPLLLPKLDSQLSKFNIDGNTNNVLILKFREDNERRLVLESFRNFNAPREIAAGPEENKRLALAVLEIAHLRVADIISSKINAKQEPQTFINLIHHAIEMRAGHLLQQKAR